MKSLKELINQWPLVLIGCATLGLAPFSPEPHLWGKLRWVWGGAEGMQLIDYGDLLLHALPWLLLIRLIILKLAQMSSKASS
ncbi:MAG: hypothetical protein AAF927_09145 [Bacteroidota bacterium]